MTGRQTCRNRRDLQPGHGVQDEGERDEEDESGDELEGRLGAESQIHQGGVVPPGCDEADEIGVVVGEESSPEEVGDPTQGTEEPGDHHREGEEPDRQREDHFEEQVEPAPSLGHDTEPPADSASAGTMDNLGDGGSPLPGTGPGQVCESGRDVERQRQEQGADPDDDGRDGHREQRDERDEPDEGNEETGKDEDTVAPQIVPHPRPPRSGDGRCISRTGHGLRIRARPSGRIGGRGFEGRVHFRIPCSLSVSVCGSGERRAGTLVGTCSGAYASSR